MEDMSEESAHPLESHLVACVQESLSLYMQENAIFLAERLVAEFPTEGNHFLLATCYHRANQPYRAYHILKGLMGAQSRYLFALSCLNLGKLTEAETALMPDNDSTKVPNGAAGFYLLGRIYQLSNRHSAAIAYYSTAVQLDPMLWSAYEELCSLGADSETQQYVGSNNTSSSRIYDSTLPNSSSQTASFDSSNLATPSLLQYGAASSTPSYGSKGGLGHIFSWMDAGKGTRVPTKDQITPMTGDYVTPLPGSRPSGPPPAPKLQAGVRSGWPSTSPIQHQQQPHVDSGATAAPQRKFVDEGKLRKVSNKLFADPASIVKQVEAEGHAPVQEADSAAVMDSGAVQGMARGVRSSEGQQAALELLQGLAEGYRLLCLYRCQEAIDAFSRLHPNQYQTGWVLNQIGRAYFEMVDYPEAARSFQWARQLDPHRLKGLELYSTVLWHMKKEVELSHLAQDAIALDRQSQFAWCVMGNCFSLQKEHETALRYFQRALQLDPTMPYAYTLCGHEYFANEDFDKGITCYRNAIRIDPRHYNAWFGMGHIYYRQEKFGMAEYHFRRALNINPRSSVLRCYLGMALHKLKRNAEALEMLHEAIEADPRNPLAKFEKASVLLAEERYRDALVELHALKDIAPREASVLFHMGKIYKRLDMVDEAMACFSNALDLQPPSADTNLIKSAIERITVADEEEEEEI